MSALYSYASSMAFERTGVDPGKMGGLPTIRDTRVTVAMVLGQVAAGRTIEQVLEDYPYLEHADTLAALSLEETLDILSDPNAMPEIRNAETDITDGTGITEQQLRARYLRG